MQGSYNTVLEYGPFQATSTVEPAVDNTVLSMSLCRALDLARSFFPTLSLSLSLSLARSLSFSRALARALSLSRSLARSLFLSLALSRALSLPLLLSLFIYLSICPSNYPPRACRYACFSSSQSRWWVSS